MRIMLDIRGEIGRVDESIGKVGQFQHKAACLCTSCFGTRSTIFASVGGSMVRMHSRVLQHRWPFPERGA